jgi:predicted MFS family arabinose efflux permease
VEAPNAGWGSPRTLLSFVGVAALLSAFVLIEQHSPNPLVRLGILRSGQLRRANFGAMALLGSWFGFQFMGTLYMQDLRDWSAVQMALAFLPAGLIVATASPNIGRVVNRFGTTGPIALGLASLAVSYVLFLNIGANTDYVTGMLPTFILAGIGFALTFGPLNMAATGGVAPEEQGLASGLVYTSFQVGGAIGLAIATAVIDAGTAASSSPAGSAAALLDGFHPAILTSLAIAVIGIAITVVPLLRGRRAPQLAHAAAGEQE